MTEDIRSMLTNRAKVPPRNSALKFSQPNKDDIQQSTTTEVKNKPLAFEDTKSASPHSAVAQQSEAPIVEGNARQMSYSASELQKIQTELEKLPQIGKRLAVHLEQQVRAELIYLSAQQEITPEIFLEAAFVALRNQPKLLEEIVTEAKERLAVRKRAGFLRRTKSMIGKIG